MKSVSEISEQVNFTLSLMFLPDEILVNIFRYLDFKSLTRTFESCQHFKRFRDDKPLMNCFKFFNYGKPLPKKKVYGVELATSVISAVSPSREWLATRALGGVILTNLVDGIVTKIKLNEVERFCFSHDSLFLCIASPAPVEKYDIDEGYKSEVKIWDLIEQKWQKPLNKLPKIAQIAGLSDGYLAIEYSNGRPFRDDLSIISIETNEELANLEKIHGNFYVSPNGKFLVSKNDDRMIEVYCFNPEKKDKPFSLLQTMPSNGSITISDTHLYSICCPNIVKIHELETLKQVDHFECAFDPVSLGISLNNNFLIISEFNSPPAALDKLHIYDLTGKKIYSFTIDLPEEAKHYYLNGLVFNQDGDNIIVFGNKFAYKVPFEKIENPFDIEKDQSEIAVYRS